MVVGIAWVVACAERREHVDEQKYMISLVNENVAGTNKVRNFAAHIERARALTRRHHSVGSRSSPRTSSNPPSGRLNRLRYYRTPESRAVIARSR